MALGIGLIVGVVGSQFMSSSDESEEAMPIVAMAPSLPSSFSAVPDAIGAQEISGPYNVVEGMKKALAA